jgi:hypothetical protein
VELYFSEAKAIRDIPNQPLSRSFAPVVEQAEDHAVMLRCSLYSADLSSLVLQQGAEEAALEPSFAVLLPSCSQQCTTG